MLHILEKRMAKEIMTQPLVEKSSMCQRPDFGPVVEKGRNNLIALLVKRTAYEWIKKEDGVPSIKYQPGTIASQMLAPFILFINVAPEAW